MTSITIGPDGQPYRTDLSTDWSTTQATVASQQEELNDIVDNVVGPVHQEVAENEVELQSIYRPLIADVSNDVDTQTIELTRIINEALAPVQAEITANGGEVQVIIEQSGVETPIVLNPSVTGTAAGPSTTGVDGSAGTTSTMGVNTTAASGFRTPWEYMAWDGPTPPPYPDCVPIVYAASPSFPPGHCTDSTINRSVGQYVYTTPEGLRIYWCEGGIVTNPTAELIGRFDVPMGYMVHSGNVTGLGEFLCPIQAGAKPFIPQEPPPTPPPVQTVPTAVPTTTTTPVVIAAPEPIQVPDPNAQAPLDGLFSPWNPCSPNFTEYLESVIKGLGFIPALHLEMFHEMMATAPKLVEGLRVETNRLAEKWNGFVDVLDKMFPMVSSEKFQVLKVESVLGHINHVLLATEKATRTFAEFLRNPTVIDGLERKNALLGAWLIRAMFAAFEDMSLGWEFMPQALSNLRISYVQIDLILDYVINYIWAVKLSDQPGIDRMFLRAELSEEETKTFTELNGLEWCLHKKELHAGRTTATEDQVMALLLQGKLTREEFKKQMRSRGWLDGSDIDTFEAANVFIPPPSDAIRFAVKDVFDPQKLGRSEMIAELQQQKGLLEALAAVGIKKTKIKPEGYEELEYDVPLCYWIASFEEASPTQVYEGLHRLRPNRVERYRFIATDAEIRDNPALLAGATATPGPKPGTKWLTPSPVTISTVNKLLKEKDYNPIWRGMLAAISYRVTGRIDTKRFYRLGVYGGPQYTAGFKGTPGVDLEAFGTAEMEMVESFQDQGYSPPEAVNHAYSVAIEVEQSKDLAKKKQQRSIVCQSYTDGVYDEKDAKDTLMATGLKEDEADVFLKTCDAKAKMRLLRTAKSAIRKGFLRGQYDTVTVRNLLKQVGVTERVRDQSLQVWTLERDSQAREAKATEMCGWVADGTMTYGQMQTRLLNLNYRPDDVERIVKHCQLGHLAKGQKEREKLLKAQQRELEQRQRLAEQKARQDETDRRRALREFLALHTDKNLEKWLNACLVTEDDIRQVYATKGVDEAAVERMLLLWKGESKCPEEGENEAPDNAGNPGGNGDNSDSR